MLDISCPFHSQKSQVSIYFKVKIDGLPIPEGRLVKGPYINQYVGTVSHVLFELLYDFQFQRKVLSVRRA